MSPEVEAELLDAIAADPDATEPRLIYADWLQAQNDPRGELIVVQSRRLAEPGDVQLAERERELTTQLTAALIAQTSEDPLSAELIARWHFGFVDALKLSVRAIRLLRSTHRGWFAQPVFAVVRELDITSKFARNLRVVRESLERTVRRLSFGDPYLALDQKTLESVAKRLPKLTGLHLRCTDVPDLRMLAPLALRELSLELHQISNAGIARITEATWPLDTFSVRIGQAVPEDQFPALAQLYNGTVLPGVKHFLVGGYNAPVVEIIETLALSKRAATVETFTADMYRVPTDAQRRLERYREALANIKFLPLVAANEYWDAETCTSMGNFLNYRLERPAEALPIYEQALRAKPEHSNARHNLGIALRKLKRFDESLVAFDTVIAQSRTPTATLFNGRHYTLCELGRRDEARADLERAVQIDANFADAWNNLGVERQYMGDVAGSRDAFRRCTQINETHGYSRRNEADLLLEIGRAKEALPIYRDLARENPGTASTHAMIAHSLVEAGDFNAARALLDARIADPTDDHPNRLHVLRALARQGLGDDAGAASDLDVCATRTECPGWFAITVYARNRGLWARAVPDSAVTPREITDAIVAHGSTTRGARAAKLHDATSDDQMDCAELAVAAALVTSDRALAVRRARAIATLYAEQGPRFFRKWFQVLATTIVMSTRDLDKDSRELLTLVLRAVRGRRRIADVLALA